MPFIPSMQEYEVPMRQLYVAPKIVEKDDKNNKEIRIKTFTDFLMKDGCLCKNIFLVGEPGTGKSTFTQNLALQWSELQLQSVLVEGDTVVEYDDVFQDTITLNMIDFLFHLSLRDANGHCSYVDIVRDQLLRQIYTPSELDQATKLVQTILECATSCILSDGLDEWSHPELGQCSCPSNVKGRTPVICQPHSAITITTSRPWRMTQCPPKESKVEKRFEIEGTSSVERLGEKVVNIMNNRSGKHEEFSAIEEYVQKKGVAHLLTIPILLLQIVCLFFDGKEVSNSQSKIYASIFDMLLGRPQDSIKNRRGVAPTFQLFADKLNIIRCWTYFTEVAKLAFEQLFPQKGHSSVVFHSNTCHLDEQVKQFALKYGILSEKQSKSFSCRSSNLTFIHKSLQEFLAAVHMGLNEDLFEIAVEPRYSCHALFAFDFYISDLSQVFIFMCGININMAEKMFKIMNTHVKCKTDISRMFLIHSSDEYTLTHLIEQGVMEADKNGFQNFRPTLYYISSHIDTIQGHDILYRLLEVNKTRVISVTVQYMLSKKNNVVLRYPSLTSYTCLTTLKLGTDTVFDTDKPVVTVSFGLDDKVLQLPTSITNIDFDHVTLRGGVSLEKCTLLEKLTFEHVDIGDHNLKLPASITSIELDHVTVRGGVSLENCTMLKELTWTHVDIGDHNLQLPASIAYIDLDHVSVRGGVSLENCTMLKELTWTHVDIGDHNLQLPASIAYIDLDHVSVRGGVSLENYTMLEFLTWKHVDIGDHNLQLPTKIEIISLDHVTVRGRVSLETCTMIERLTLKHVFIGEHNLKLPASITHIDLDHVTVRGGVSLETCTIIEELTLKYVDIGEHNLQLSASITSIDLDHVTVRGGVSLETCTIIEELTLKHVDIGEHNLQLSASITSIDLDHVTVRGGVSLENCTRLSWLKLKHVDIGDHNLQLPTKIEIISLYHVTVRGGVSLETCTMLEELSMKHVDIGDHNLQLPSSITRIDIDHVTVRWGVSLETCTMLKELSLKHVDIGDHNLQLPASIKSIDLDNVTVRGGVSLASCTRLERLKLKHADLKDNNLQLPISIKKIDLHHVSVPGGFSLENCTMLKGLKLKHVDIIDHTLQLPASIKNIDLDHVILSGGVSLENGTRLNKLTLKHVDLKDNTLYLPASIWAIHFDNVIVTGGVSFQDCKNIAILELKDVKHGDHDLAIPDNVFVKRVINVSK